ncbi:hypothetical protein NLU13_9613 [Sarocladium strictum]|uniref:Uncharacterized protein n=1 Tax=Sarocladium strictum TaxID=5046 RepID=A0AA39L4C9_SARSR|nr:hypothetical protein NLU13_9613 [Sarocladium strictum]
MRLDLVAIATALLLASDSSATRCAKNFKDNFCFRSVASAEPRSKAIHDCANYLRVTVTPQASTTTTVLIKPTTEVSTIVTTSVTTVDESTTDSTQTNWISETRTVNKDTSTSTVTEYATKTVEAGSDPQARDVDLDARYAPAKEEEYPAYAATCGSFEKYSSACRCIGVCPQTTTVPIPTVTATRIEYSTQVSTKVVLEQFTEINFTPVTETTEKTTYLATETVWKHTATQTTTIYTATITSIVRNGGFESGEFEPWIDSDDNQIDIYISQPGDNSKWTLESGNMVNNDLLEIYQVTLATAGETYQCTYDWKFDNYYETYYQSTGKTYIPYVHVYIGDSTSYIDWVSPDETTKGTWQTSTFQFTAAGADKLWFDCASPQPRHGTGGGRNKVYLDNIACSLAQT